MGEGRLRLVIAKNVIRLGLRLGLRLRFGLRLRLRLSLGLRLSLSLRFGLRLFLVLVIQKNFAEFS
jgi:hypothetical protein